MSRVTTKILRMDTGRRSVVAAKPVKWTDEQWDELVQKNREFYEFSGFVLVEEDWSYGK